MYHSDMDEYCGRSEEQDCLNSVNAMALLKDVGQQLDRNIFPVVKNGGLVVANPSLTQYETSLMEKGHERKASRRSQAGPRPWSETRQRQARRSRQACATPSIVSEYIKKSYEDQLEAVGKAYPSCKFWQQSECLWLIVESSVLPGCWHKAAFVTGLSYVFPFIVRSWGFWISGISTNPVWIGPRHTNFPDGSICAFEPRDHTWCAGQSIVTLLDLYSLWAFRHRHLELLGRWPGRQSVWHPYERLQELKSNEFCGCHNSDRLYKDCCRDADLARDRIADALDFRNLMGRDRRPPEVIVDFVKEREMPPEYNRMLNYE